RATKLEPGNAMVSRVALLPAEGSRELDGLLLWHRRSDALDGGQHDDVTGTNQRHVDTPLPEYHTQHWVAILLLREQLIVVALFRSGVARVRVLRIIDAERHIHDHVHRERDVPDVAQERWLVVFDVGDGLDDHLLGQAARRSKHEQAHGRPTHDAIELGPTHQLVDLRG